MSQQDISNVISLSWQQLSDETSSYAIYVNIPFCNVPCLFCHYIPNLNFHYASVPDSYINMLIRQIRKILSLSIPYRRVVSCYIGGGTPSLLTYQQLNNLCKVLDDYIKEFDEVCVEIHPSTWNERYIDIERITRFSLGVQTFNQERLNRWNRISYTFEDILNITGIIRHRAPAAIINIDLLFYNIIDEQDVLLAQKLNPDSITVYPKTGRKKIDEVKLIKESIRYAAVLLSDYQPIGNDSFIFCKGDKAISKYSIHEYKNAGDIIGLGHNSVTFLKENAYLCSYNESGFSYCPKYIKNRYFNILLQGITIGVTEQLISKTDYEFLKFLKPHHDPKLWYLPKYNIRNFYEYLENQYPIELRKVFLKSIFYGDDRPELISEAENVSLFYSD